MNRKGFTLIELLATITLLGAIAMISFVSINGIVNQSKINNCETTVKNIKLAASEYVSDNRYNDNFINAVNNYKVRINARTLIDNKYLSNIINPFDKSSMNSNDIIIDIVLNNDYTFKNATINDPNRVFECAG